ncbi:Protein asteroid -like protein 1 [Halotydeus destructor]|nr:Protein asteroid -like protein 1 [Halotydeus destructor]
MGVKGLTTFVESDPESLKCYKLQDTKLVIDGNSLKYFLYEIFAADLKCSRYAGDYVDYGRYIQRFFKCLKTCNVTPYIIMDGAIDPSLDKLDELKSRATEKIKRAKPKGKNFIYSPLLDSKVFGDVVVDLDLDITWSLFEADGDVANLAKKLKCPVLAKDSDFMIFDLEGGYIPLSTLTYQDDEYDLKICENDKAYLECMIYYIDDFACHMRIKKDVLPLVALQFGYDLYPVGMKATKTEIFESSRGLTAKQAIDNYLSKGNKSARYEKLHKTYEFYQFECYTKCICARYALQHMCNKCSKKRDRLKIDHKLPEDLTNLVVSGQMDPKLLNYRTGKVRILKVQAEDMSKPSSHTFTLRLQKYVIALMRMSVSEFLRVTNLDRVNNIYQCAYVTANTELPNGKACPIFTDIATMSRSERKKVLFKILTIKKNSFNSMAKKVKQTDLLSREQYLELATLVTILKTARQEADLSDAFCAAMITCAIYYLYVETPPDRYYGTSVIRVELRQFTKSVKPKVQAHLVHDYCQFQAIYVVVRQLYSILGYPIANCRPHVCLSGTLINNLHEYLHDEANPGNTINEILQKNQELSNLFVILFDYVVS